ncbi:Uncharacterised protein [uncultured archaeon]|nr:Uncharacterised protein [uncultured archaeon]
MARKPKKLEEKPAEAPATQEAQAPVQAGSCTCGCG